MGFKYHTLILIVDTEDAKLRLYLFLSCFYFIITYAIVLHIFMIHYLYTIGIELVYT